MSARVEKLAKDRSLPQHRAAITQERCIRGGEQAILDTLAEAITDLNAAVAKLIDLHMSGRTSRRDIRR